MSESEFTNEAVREAKLTNLVARLSDAAKLAKSLDMDDIEMEILRVLARIPA